MSLEFVQVFAFGSLAVLVLTGFLTRSVGGAFLGLAVVYLAGAFYFFNQGGLSILGGIGMLFLGLLCLVLCALLTVNISHAVMTHVSPDGARSVAHHTLLGDGARRSTSHWVVPTSRQLTGGTYNPNQIER